VGRGAGLVCDAKLGIVGGSNLNDSKLFEHLEKRLVETEYGDVIVYDSPPDAEKQICFVKRHYCGPDESYVPPHLVKAPAFLKVGDVPKNGALKLNAEKLGPEKESNTSPPCHARLSWGSRAQLFPQSLASRSGQIEAVADRAIRLLGGV
jgi:hypothetical protein